MPETPAEAFLRALAESRPDDGALLAIADDEDGFHAALESRSDALGRAIEQAADGGGGTACVTATAFASAAIRSDGRMAAADDAFADLRFPPRVLSKVLQMARSGAPRLSSIMDDASGRPVAVVVAPAERALAWPLSRSVRAALTAGEAEIGVLAARSAEAMIWPALFSAWSFSRAETRLTEALIRLGDLRDAAAELAISYETAREALASAMTKVGARRQPEFVRHLTLLALGELQGAGASWRTFADAFSLTARQARLAVLIGYGATRAAAAASLGVSEHTAKAELKIVFDRCGVARAATLGRVVAETDALARLAAATDVEVLGRDRTTTPLRFIRRRRCAGRNAVEDHGPPSGAPVVIFHTPLNGRHLPRRLVRALHARGLRPISVERPGFGLTSEADGNFVEDANADLIDVLDALGLERVRLLGRSVAMPLRFAAAHPHRVERGVLIAAIPPGTRPKAGLLGTAVALALDHPGMVEGFVRLMVRLSSEQAIMRLTERSLRSSTADLAALADEATRADWIRASRQSSTGDGFSRELVLHADGGSMPPGCALLRLDRCHRRGGCSGSRRRQPCGSVAGGAAGGALHRDPGWRAASASEPCRSDRRRPRLIRRRQLEIALRLRPPQARSSPAPLGWGAPSVRRRPACG